MTKEEKFEINLINNSKNQNYESVKNEWSLFKIQYYNEGLIINKEDKINNNCICGQKHLKKLVYIKNKENEKILLIGSNCACQFFGWHEQKSIFADIVNLYKNIMCPVSTKSLKWLLGKNILNEDFYKKIRRIYFKEQKNRSDAEKDFMKNFHLDFQFLFTKKDFEFQLQKYKNIDAVLKAKFEDLHAINLTQKDKNFIESLEDYFNNKGYLTEKQLIYFYKIYENNIEAA